MTRYRRRPPSKLRFLAALEVALWALGFLIVETLLERVMCKLSPSNCGPIFTEWLDWLTMGIIALSAIACAYRYWADFIKGEYYLDVEDPNWRHRTTTL